MGVMFPPKLVESLVGTGLNSLLYIKKKKLRAFQDNLLKSQNPKENYRNIKFLVYLVKFDVLIKKTCTYNTIKSKYNNK